MITRMFKVFLYLGVCIQGAAYALDRSTALRAIQNSDYYPRYETLMSPLPVGSPVNISVVVQAVKRTDQRMGQSLDTGYACAQKLGFLDIRSERKVVFGTDMGTFYHVSITNKGLDNGWVLNEKLYGYRQEM